jgi:shikimate dehydrogenase
VTRPAVSGSTSVYGLAGDPVAHSLSPALHNAAFEALGIDAVSVALRADVDAAASVVSAVRAIGIRGLSITMPLKSAVVAYCEEHTEVVARLGSCNVLTSLRGEAVRADSTDGEGLLDAIRCVAGLDLDGARCAVLGAGGAARAVIDALAHAGAREVIVVARRTEAAASAAALASVARPGEAAEAQDADVVVQATPVGMQDTPARRADGLLDGAMLGAGQVAVDLVYHPRVTRWLAGATASGATPVQGVEVLIHQAQLALTGWLGVPVPLAPLHEVAVST